MSGISETDQEQASVALCGRCSSLLFFFLLLIATSENIQTGYELPITPILLSFTWTFLELEFARAQFPLLPCASPSKADA